MVQPRTWWAIPAVAVACAGIALAAVVTPPAALAIGLCAAAVAAAVRAFAGPSLAAAIAGATAGVLATCCVLELRDLPLARGALGAAAALFAISELARPQQPDSSPWPAIGAAFAAAALDASFVALIAITGVRFVRGPWSRPQWSIAIPAFGALAIVVALAAALTRVGMFAELWTLWAGRVGHAAPLALLARIGDLLGPIAAVAALAGIAVCASRGRFAITTIAVLVLSALCADLASGALGAATPALAAMAAGIALARLAALVRSPRAQPFVGATFGFVIVLAAAMLRL